MNRARRSPHIHLCLATLALLVVSCSDSKDDSGPSPGALFAEVRKSADRVAELSASVAIATLSPQGDSVDATAEEIGTRYSSDVEGLKESVCTTLRESGKNASDDEQDSLRATVNEALRDSFVLKFLEGAVAASPERQAELVQILAIESEGADGAPLQGAAALRDTALSSAEGSVQIPPRGTTAYTKYTDWLGGNDAFAGFTDTMTAAYTKAVRQCPIG